jgi:transcriptional regulator with XRE-family HTH domain
MTPPELRAARLTLGLTQAEMAAALTDPEHDKPAVDQRTVRRWETGNREIPHPVVIVVKSMLGISGPSA